MLRVSACVTITNVATSGVAALTRPVIRPTVAESQGENPKPIQPTRASTRADAASPSAQRRCR